jgi:hypothetical protein
MSRNTRLPTDDYRATAGVENCAPESWNAPWAEEILLSPEEQADARRWATPVDPASYSPLEAELHPPPKKAAHVPEWALCRARCGHVVQALEALKRVEGMHDAPSLTELRRCRAGILRYNWHLREATRELQKNLDPRRTESLSLGQLLYDLPPLIEMLAELGEFAAAAAQILCYLRGVSDWLELLASDVREARGADGNWRALATMLHRTVGWVHKIESIVPGMDLDEVKRQILEARQLIEGHLAGRMGRN